MMSKSAVAPAGLIDHVSRRAVDIKGTYWLSYYIGWPPPILHPPIRPVCIVQRVWRVLTDTTPDAVVTAPGNERPCLGEIISYIKMKDILELNNIGQIGQIIGQIMMHWFTAFVRLANSVFEGLMMGVMLMRRVENGTKKPSRLCHRDLRYWLNYWLTDCVFDGLVVGYRIRGE